MYPRCRHLEPLLTGFQFTTLAASGGSASIDKGSNDFPSPVRTSAGKVTVPIYDTGLFGRGPLIIGTPGDSVADGGYACYATAPASGSHVMQNFDKTATGDDGTGHVIALGFGSVDTDRYDDSQIVKSTFSAPQFLAWRIANSGTVSIGSGGNQATVSRVSTGIVTVTFTPAWPLVRSIAATAVNAACRSARITAISGTSVTVKVTDKDGTVQDSDFILFGLFSCTTDETGREFSRLKCPQLLPEFIGGRLVNSAGTPTITIGGATNGIDFTVADAGVGLYTVTLSRAFQRGVLPIPCAKASRAQIMATPSSSAFQIGVFDKDGVAADDDVDFILIGYDGGTSEEF